MGESPQIRQTCAMRQPPNVCRFARSWVPPGPSSQASLRRDQIRPRLSGLTQYSRTYKGESQEGNGEHQGVSRLGKARTPSSRQPPRRVAAISRRRPAINPAQPRSMALQGGNGAFQGDD